MYVQRERERERERERWVGMGVNAGRVSSRSAVLRPSVHMLPGICWCGTGLLPFPTACWWLTHPAAITRVSVATRWNSPGGCGGPSVVLLARRLSSQLQAKCISGTDLTRQYDTLLYWYISHNLFSLPVTDRGVGLLVTASALRAKDPGFESHLQQDFSGVESYQWLQNWYSSGYPARHLVL